MAQSVLTNCKLYLDKHDLSGDMNAAAMQAAADVLDSTTFGLGTRRAVAGIRAFDVSFEGLFDPAANAVDSILQPLVGANTILAATLCPTDGASEEPAFIVPSIVSRYTPSFPHGDLARFGVGLSVKRDDNTLHNPVRGVVAAAKNARTTTGNSNVIQLGALSATQRMWVAVHMFSRSGTPTIQLDLASDDNGGMTTPTTRLTLNNASLATDAGYLTSVAGAITDTYWRWTWTIGGGTPSLTFAIAMGIY